MSPKYKLEIIKRGNNFSSIEWCASVLHNYGYLAVMLLRFISAAINTGFCVTRPLVREVTYFLKLEKHNIKFSNLNYQKIRLHVPSGSKGHYFRENILR